MRIWAVLGVLILIVGIVVLNSSVSPPPVVSDFEVTTRKVATGAWVEGFWDSKTKTLDTKAFTDFENKLDTKLAIANFYADWTNLPNRSFLRYFQEMSDNGWVPMISSNPHFFDGCPKEELSLYAAIAAGRCDEFLEASALNLKEYGQPILFRFAWEMNLPQMYWGVDYVKSEPSDFVNTWKRMHDVFEKNNVDNVYWVLSFNTSNPSTTPYAELFPGDEYVDWVAIDGYNWGNSQSWGGWVNFNGVFRNSYDELTKITTKPVMLSEVNSGTDGGDKAEWLKDMLEVQIPKNYPQVEAIVFFNENKTEGEKVDWRLEKSEAYLNTVKNSLKKDIYSSTLIQ